MDQGGAESPPGGPAQIRVRAAAGWSRECPEGWMWEVREEERPGKKSGSGMFCGSSRQGSRMVWMLVLRGVQLLQISEQLGDLWRHLLCTPPPPRYYLASPTHINGYPVDTHCPRARGGLLRLTPDETEAQGGGMF